MTEINELRQENWLRREPRPAQLRSRALRAICDNLIMNGGTTSHSGFGLTLRLTLERLEGAGVPYVLVAQPLRGYWVKVPPPQVRDPEGFSDWLKSWSKP